MWKYKPTSINLNLKWLLLVCIVILFVIYMFFKQIGTNHTLQQKHEVTTGNIVNGVNKSEMKQDYTELLSFLHKDTQGMCERIFTESAGRSYLDAILPYYDMLAEEHDVSVEKLINKYGKKCMVGSSKNYKEETYVMWNLARLPFVKTICETGFNAGYSTHLWLMANPHAKVYSFDIGTLKCSKNMSNFLIAKYPGRLNITWGDSTETMPRFIKENPDVKCDLMVIDGGHTYTVAKQDRINFHQMSSNSMNIVFIDNYPDFRFKNELAHAWEEGIRELQVSELFSCHYKNYQQGFAFGTFTKS